MIVIPMAGMSRRFDEAGYDKPKYMLPLPGGSVFHHAIGSFRAYFETDQFLFIARNVADTRGFIEHECATLGVAHPIVAMLDAPTAGQAETVASGLACRGLPLEAPITIFNIDTFRPGFLYPDAAWFARSDGYLEVFRGSGGNWSYVLPAGGEEPVVAETAEKRPISDLCSTGLYHFRAAGDFLEALAAERNSPSAPEFYVAPLYNHLIRRGRAIHFSLIAASSIVFCGVPSEYEVLVSPGSVTREPN